MDAYKIRAQVDWEVAGFTRAAERFREAAAAREVDELPGGQRLLREIVPPLVRHIEQEQRECLISENGAGRQGAYVWVLQQLPAEKLAVIAAVVCLRAASSEEHIAAQVVTASLVISEAIRMQIEHDEWVAKENASVEHQDALRAFQRRYPNVDTRIWRRWRKKFGEVRRERWSKTRALQVGSFFIQALASCSAHFVLREVREGVRTWRILRLSPQACDLMLEMTTRAELARPLVMATIIPPLPWRYDANGVAEGGLYITKVPLIRTGRNRHTAELDRPVSALDFEALNAVQATPWRVNDWLLEVAREAWLQVSFGAPPLAGMEKAQPLPIPPKLPDDVWEAMSKEERKAHGDSRQKVHAHNASALGREVATVDKLAVAGLLSEHDEVWFPHSRDWRGRIYPIPAAGAQPQGDDLSKGLLMFAAGLPLGPDGEFWLCVRAGSMWEHGIEKLALEDRVKWALEHAEDIRASAEDPLAHSWWATAEKPWQFLATCHELRQAWACEDASAFVSHLPIPLDGTCNGLQHLSAMGLDPVGAHATNLCAGAERQDIYAEVAARVAAAVDADAAKGIPEALHWQGKVTRKTVKRAVMTTPYGVTNRGIARQLVLDGNVPKGEVKTIAAANYLRDRLVEALEDTVSGAKGIMGWLQGTAQALSQAGMPFDWTTPSGSRCRQAYSPLTQTQVRTLCGRLVLLQSADGLIDEKQALGAAPNYVHSFDAAHLAMTVLVAHKRGIGSFSMVHDSYGTHACHTTQLAALLRWTFVEIYRADHLAELEATLRAMHPHVQLPPRPRRGSFALMEVLEAPFFFS